VSLLYTTDLTRAKELLKMYKDSIINILMASFEFPSRSQPDRMHMQTISTFRQKFPVDSQQEDIQFLVSAALPETIDTGLTLQGCTQTISSVTEAGGVQLFPLISSERLSEPPLDELTELQQAHETFRILTEHHRLSLAHYEVDCDAGVFTDFRIALIDQQGDGRFVYELSGYTEDGPIGDYSEYYLTTHDTTTNVAGEYLPIDKALAESVIDALISQQREHVMPTPTLGLQAKLQQLVDASVNRRTTSVGDYRLGDSQELTLSIARQEETRQGSKRTVTLAMYLEEKATTHVDGIAYATPRGLTLEYDEVTIPPYRAAISQSFSDPDAQVPIYIRDRTFDTLVETFRARQPEFFRALYAAAARLTEI
jgi:hypothetical protein